MRGHTNKVQLKKETKPQSILLRRYDRRTTAQVLNNLKLTLGQLRQIILLQVVNDAESRTAQLAINHHQQRVVHYVTLH